MKEPPGASFFIPGSLNTGVSNKVEPFGGCSQKDVSLEFEGMAGRSDRIEDQTGIICISLAFWNRNNHASSER